MDDRQALIAISFYAKISPAVCRNLLKSFSSYTAVWQAKTPDLVSAGLPIGISRDFAVYRLKYDPGWISKILKAKNIRVITVLDEAYPKMLREIFDPPLALYVKSSQKRRKLAISRAVAVVGSRKMTAYGRQMTITIVRQLVSAGFLIVSGMAAGVDRVAHETAFCSGGDSVAVLGCGVDICAPESNRHIYDKLAGGGRGAVISEWPPGYFTHRSFFAARNRIISGLSLGIVVIEGTKFSGSLITARYAAEQGREVFAVPGPVTSPASQGPLALIKDGAIPVTAASDIIDELGG